MEILLIFNYNTQYDSDLIKFLKKELQSLTRYYLTRSWEGGPHIKVVLDNETDIYQIEKISKSLQIWMTNIPINPMAEEEIITKYKKHASVLSKLEDKEEVSTMEKHGTVRVVDDPFFYHNREITHLFHEIRFDLQDLLSELYFYLIDNKIPIQAAYPILFHYVSETYKVDGMNKGYFSFISHVHGFFELAEKQQLSYNEESFEQYYQNNKTYIDTFAKEHAAFVHKWSEKWKDIFQVIQVKVDDVTDQSYIERIRREFTSIQSNFNNDFHHRFTKYADDERFVYDQSATVYRFLINLLYMSLPFLRISALKKQQFIYMAYRYTEETYQINWREQIGITD
ncbi:hypothetical protein D8M04_15130 [Oceanobacillus piezotolerans]|uniref:Thiopeptide-type bacteriocin biosynthesis domain-containing protein n=1 Tax=Oceanobacillus piezotolerans TaxID=2448030 RepID=A0A498D4J1_9BACI|nr:hypothetical protein [Oceanobacillus piezotolerans]RLL42879.1 hypothetical protein D8M04_15130 [Oceanobacillus piezotolerans]